MLRKMGRSSSSASTTPEGSESGSSQTGGVLKLGRGFDSSLLSAKLTKKAAKSFPGELERTTSR
eukprot:CAMPEP_0184287916 /NCGR_PEP_ID=MMETSP1049-20130417/330_1 /TAXON_ID=77928 /ORGANISM="Proteomonas sulcata, Strain CCMP704" /LENGTH=63 /DNA_ID=CAMNT_0026594041 /DNA_START=510 /DNA_END=701 /DNA_ORIENTATION=+